jgi:capsular polysaccharide biosynthesis protein
LVISDEWTSNYYHWHFFALKKLLALQEVEELKNALLFLPKKYQKYPFVLPSLEKFGIDKNRIVFLPRKSNIKVAKAATAKISQQHVLAFRKMREILTKDCANSARKFGERVYLSRQQQVLRRVENEEAVTQLLEKFGFKKIIAEQLSYQDQTQLFSQAKYLVSPHGAGLSNILFMQDGTKILELASKPYEYKPVTDYYKLASMMNVDYFYQECEMAESSQVKDFHHANLVVDLKKLEENLKLMIGNE